MITLYLLVLAYKNNYKNMHIAHRECEQLVHKHLILILDFYTQVHEISLVPRKKTSQSNMTFSQILINISRVI